MQVEGQFCSINVTKFIFSSRDELPGQLTRSLDKIAQEEGYSSYNVSSRTISTDGGNYLGTLYEVDIKGHTENGEKETNIFIKYVISQEHITILDLSDIYSKELFFYKDVRKLFMELENGAAIPFEERYKSIKCYGESSTEAIILQNLSKNGYSTIYRMDVMPLQFAELSVKQLAKFHALSFIIEHKRPQYYERKIKTLIHSVKFDSKFQNFCKRLYKYSVRELDKGILRKLDKNLENHFNKYTKYLMGDTNVKCLCHGDYRINNILMKVKDGEITDVIPIDFQFIHYGSPIVDFMYFIFSATDKEFRKNHLENLKEIYYESMKDYLKYFKISIDSIYPRKEFERDYDECLEFGLYAGIFFMPVIFTTEGDVPPDFSNNDLLDIQVKLDHRFKDRFQGIIDDMIQWGKL